MTYTITVVLTTDEHTDEHLQTEPAIRDEVTSWLESLHATVHAVRVRPATEDERSAS